MKWRVDVDVIRSAGRELYSKHFRSLSDAWGFIRNFAVLGDRFVIDKTARAEVQRVATYEESRLVGALGTCAMCFGLGYYLVRISGRGEAVRVNCRDASHGVMFRAVLA